MLLGKLCRSLLSKNGFRGMGISFQARLCEASLKRDPHNPKTVFGQECFFVLFEFRRFVIIFLRGV